jgi:hypothetical protein
MVLERLQVRLEKIAAADFVAWSGWPVIGWLAYIASKHIKACFPVTTLAVEYETV